MGAGMLSHRKLFSITLMMGVLFALFILTWMYRVSVNEYDTNAYAGVETGIRESDAFDPLSADGQRAGTEGGGRQVVFIGQPASGMGNVVSQWCTYSKRALACFPGLTEYLEQETVKADILCLDPGALNWAQAGVLLSEQARQNTTVIFGGLPEEETLLECPSLCQLLGIEGVRVPGGVEVSGIYLSGGFLIGGDAVYRADSPAEAKRQDLELNVPWYQLSSQTKVYLSGLQEGEDAGRNTRPPLIWRNTVGKMRVFAVIGGYLQDETGLGILEGMMAESSTFDLYPVVNAQNLSVAYYPSFASENRETLQRIYSSGMELVVQNIIWPSLLSISEQSEFKPTCFLTPQFFYQGDAEPKASSLSFYLKQIKDRQGEVGWSAGGMDELPVLEKWSRDQAFLAQAESAYTYTAAYAPEDQVDALAGAAEIPELRTITGETPEDGALLSFVSEDVTFQGVTHKAEEYRYSDDLRNRSLQTALGYTNILMDMRRVLWPEKVEEQWEHYSQAASGNIGTWWKTYQYFDKTTASETDSRVRSFLALDFTATRQNETITLQVENRQGTVSFLLRTHDKEVRSVTGGSVFRIEKDAYLITVSEDEVQINLKN